jgi:hypothetical protein
MMKTISPVWLTRIGIFALALSVFTACDDSTGVDGEVDIEGTEAAVNQVINQFFVSNPGIQSLEIFGAQIGQALPSVTPFNLSLTPGEASLHGLADRLRESVASVYIGKPAGATLMAIPSELLGTTFEWNAQTGQYEPGQRAGAPDNGVRFILYDGISTLNEVGHLDFIDASNFSVVPVAVDVTLSIVITDVGEVLHYRITGSASETGGTLLVDGFLSDGADQLDFDFSFSGTEATGSTATFTLTAGSLTMSLDVSNSTTGAGSISIEITHGNDEILFVLLVAEDGTLQGGSGIFFGNTPVAVFSGNIETNNVTVTNAEGAPLTQEQLLALAEIFVGIEQAFIVVEGLFELGLLLIGLAVFL